MATMIGAACFAVSGISETLGQEKEKSWPVYITTEEVAETTYTPEIEEATQPTLAKNMFPVCPVGLSSDNYYVFDKEDLLRDNWQRKPAYGKVDPAVISEHTET